MVPLSSFSDGPQICWRELLAAGQRVKAARTQEDEGEVRKSTRV